MPCLHSIESAYHLALLQIHCEEALSLAGRRDEASYVSGAVSA